MYHTYEVGITVPCSANRTLESIEEACLFLRQGATKCKDTSFKL